MTIGQRSRIDLSTHERLDFYLKVTYNTTDATPKSRCKSEPTIGIINFKRAFYLASLRKSTFFIFLKNEVVKMF